MGIIDFLLDASGFLPRWHCGTGWTKSLEWTHIISDFLIFLSYFSILITIVYFALKRKDIPFQKISILFIGFIFLCGFAHLIEAIIFWEPLYRFAALIKVLIAAISVTTAIALIILIPKLLNLAQYAGLKLFVASIVDSSKDAIISFNNLGTIKTMNQAALTLFRVNENDIIGTPLTASFPYLFLSHKNWEGRLSELITNKGGNEYQVLVVIKGNKYLLHISVSPVFSLNDALIGGALTIRDITSIKRITHDLNQANLRLKESKKFYEDFYENAPDMFLSMDFKTLKVTNCNLTLCEALGYKKDEVIGLSIMKFYTLESQKIAKNSIKSFVDKGYIRNVELTVIKKSGETIPVILNTTAVKDEQGRIIKIRATWRDITPLKNAYNQIKTITTDSAYQKKKLETISQRLNAILNSAIDGIITMDSKGVIETINPAAQKIFGYRYEELIGKNVKMLMPKEFSGSHDQYLQNYLNASQAKMIGIGREGIGLRKDGSTFPLDLAVSEMHIEGQSRFTGIVRDITARKTIENELREANGELETFVYTASHDLREPLRGIHNYATFLLEDYDTLLDQKGKNKLIDMKNLALKLDQFIDSLLHFSKISHTQYPQDLIDMNQLVRQVLHTLKASLEEKQVRVEVQENLPSVICNDIAISEVFQNLITNAIKYNDKNAIIIEIGYKYHENTDLNIDEALFFVKDNGIGIKDQHHSSIFKIFKRLHERDKYGGGTGAGLTIVKKIIDKHKGKIWVESQVGVGTTFYFTLNKGGIHNEYASAAHS